MGEMVNESMINFSDWRLLFVNKDGWKGALFCEERKDAGTGCWVTMGLGQKIVKFGQKSCKFWLAEIS